MGTNFYLKRIPTKEEIDEIKEKLDNSEFEEAIGLIQEHTREEHIGKRSCGWQFHFDLSKPQYPGDVSSNGMDIPPEEFSLEMLKKYIQSHLMENWKLMDEYNQTFTEQEFFEEEVGDSLYQGEKYHNMDTYSKKYPERTCHWGKNTEYTSPDGLRYDTRNFS